MSGITDDRQIAEDFLARAVPRLVNEFAGRHAAPSVERCLCDSYAELAKAATVSAYLPLLAERFARERLAAASRAHHPEHPAVLFVCSHNSGRSQIAAGWLARLAPQIEVWSAGTAPAAGVSPAVVEAMAEVGIDLADAYPKPLTEEVIGAADVVVTMGCGEACPVVPGRCYEDWAIGAPLGDAPRDVRAARDEIRARVEGLIDSLAPAPDR